MQGLRCLVTGGSRNLGRAMVEALAAAGHRVAFTYSTRDEDARATQAAVPEALVFKGSVADAAHARATIDALVAGWGGLDVLVNNAGVMQVLPIALLEEADWDRAMNVNVKGAYLFSRAALRPMLKARKGHIVNIGSFVAGRVVRGAAHYAASKAALHGFTCALAAEVGRFGVQVNTLAPGLLDRGLAARLPQHRTDEYRKHAALGRTGQADEIARLLLFMLSPGNTFMTGANLVADGGV